MPIIVETRGSCGAGQGEWSYTVEYEVPEMSSTLTYHDSGTASGTTSRQMKLMAILRGLEYAKSLDLSQTIIIKSDSEWCVKCLMREYDCVSDDRFKTESVTRAYVQYLREIWWKMAGVAVEFQVMDESVI
ncbi:hypothetical protein EU546_08265 [Candidatus Thorarchaeota archaeon]|nr:MAG: hypothetical protein EU546_08265 [Candidatus Thorarchaeota archaeon]